MKQIKRGIAVMLAVVLVFSLFLGTNHQVYAAASKTIVVSSQKQLNAAIKDKQITKIVIKTKDNKSFKISGGKLNKKSIVISAPKATVSNSAKCKGITINSAKKYTENAKNNSIKVTAKDVNIVVSKKASVKSITLDKKGAKPVITVNGTVKSIRVMAKATVTIAGTAKSETKIVVSAGAENTKVVAKNDNTVVKITNNTNSKVEVENKEGKTTSVEAGASTKVDVKDDTIFDDKDDKDDQDSDVKPSPSAKPSTEPSEEPAVEPTKAPGAGGGASSGGSTSGGASSGGGSVKPPVIGSDINRTGYTEVWKDDFNGTSLNREDWNVETHEPGWVNAELQAYVDSPDNIQVKDGKLIIKPIQSQDENGNKTYTSGRVNTQGKHDFTYGLFEARAKVPAGKGYLPAFWMMPTNENLYGQWPKCGEIDIMEVMGHETDKVYGTIHYGNPHGQRQTTKKLASDIADFASEYHDFAVEWEPGKIVWYVDGYKFHEANDWYSATPGQGTVSYPAPFDQPFYMILNLAVGGSWVGYPDETTTYDDQEYAIDYVKVSRKSNDYYENILNTLQKPVKAPVVEPADGKYVKNGDFAVAEDLTSATGWQFMTAQGGEAQAAIVADEHFGTGSKAIKISTTKAGNEDYSVQLVQANIPLKQGNKYTVSFDAYAAENRSMIVDISAPDLNYARYLNDSKVDLTTAVQTYTMQFDMTEADDANGRLEFNLGKTAAIGDVYISNVKIIKGDSFEISHDKTVQADGNYITNGNFQQDTETGIKNMLEWNVEDRTEKAVYGVTGVADNRRFHITSEGCASVDQVVLKQTELPLTAGKYELSFDASAVDVNNPTIKVTVGGQEKEFTLSEATETYTCKVEVPSDADIKAIDDIIFALGVNGKVFLDNVYLIEDTLIKNGSFNAGLAGWEPYANSPSNISYVVDSISEDNAFDITIQNTGDADWHIQLKQNNVALEKDQWYKLSFDIKSSMARKVSYAIQRDGSKHNDDWTPYVQEVIDIGDSYQHIVKVFKMKLDTDPESIFNVTMGAVGGTQIEQQHRICIDNINLEVTEAQEEPIVSIETGVNMLSGEQDAWIQNKREDTSVSSDEKSFLYTIKSLGEASYEVELKQVNLQFEEGCKYEIAFDVTSSVDRSIKTIVQENGGSWTTYSADNFKVKADTPLTYKHYFEMQSPTDAKALFAIDMGKVKEADYGTHTIQFSNITVKKITEEQYAQGLEAEQARKDAEKADVPKLGYTVLFEGAEEIHDWSKRWAIPVDDWSALEVGAKLKVTAEMLPEQEYASYNLIDTSWVNVKEGIGWDYVAGETRTMDIELTEEILAGAGTGGLGMQGVGFVVKKVEYIPFTEQTVEE